MSFALLLTSHRHRAKAIARRVQPFKARHRMGRSAAVRPTPVPGASALLGAIIVVSIAVAIAILVISVRLVFRVVAFALRSARR